MVGSPESKNLSLCGVLLTLIHQALCMWLFSLQSLGVAGDGYDGRKSPHTANEMFAGLTLSQVTKVHNPVATATPNIWFQGCQLLTLQNSFEVQQMFDQTSVDLHTSFVL